MRTWPTSGECAVGAGLNTSFFFERQVFFVFEPAPTGPVSLNTRAEFIPTHPQFFSL